MNVMALFVNSWVFINATFASSKRSSSNDCLPNARMTEMPLSISRDTRFTRSMSFCMILNFGMATAMRMNMTTKMAATAKAMIQLMEKFVLDTMNMPPTARMGA